MANTEKDIINQQLFSEKDSQYTVKCKKADWQNIPSL